MSARQNKKRGKGRNNANNRERTVTTLREDPNTPYLVPTPCEEPPGSTLMSSPFSASSPTGHPSSAYQPPGSYNTLAYNPTFGPVLHPQQFYQQPQVILPPGKNDLEILEKLKEMIKNGQHELYRAVPQPAALASIYLGPHASQVPHHPEQAPDPQQAINMNRSSHSVPTGGSEPPSPVDLSRHPPRAQTTEAWDPSAQKKPITTPTASSASSGAQASNVLLISVSIPRNLLTLLYRLIKDPKFTPVLTASTLLTSQAQTLQPPTYRRLPLPVSNRSSRPQRLVSNMVPLWILPLTMCAQPLRISRPLLLDPTINLLVMSLFIVEAGLLPPRQFHTTIEMIYIPETMEGREIMRLFQTIDVEI